MGENWNPKDMLDLETKIRANWIQFAATVAQIIGGTVLLVGVYFTWANLNVSREGQITDRFTRAIDQIGASYAVGTVRQEQPQRGRQPHLAARGRKNNKVVAPEPPEPQQREPNLEVRLGGIYALVRIARESPEDCQPVAQILTAYVRENAHRTDNRPAGPSLRTDIATILTLLGGSLSSDCKGRLDLGETDLRSANLQDADLSWANLYRANLSGASMFGANLSGAFLPEANLSGAFLAGANLSKAVLLRANLSGVLLLGADISEAVLYQANLSAANLSTANLHEATLFQANLDKASLSAANLSAATLHVATLIQADLRNANLSAADLSANLHDANLSGANLSRADLSGAEMSGVNLSGADISGAFLRDSSDLTQEQVDSAMGDKKTTLPRKIVRPN